MTRAASPRHARPACLAIRDYDSPPETAHTIPASPVSFPRLLLPRFDPHTGCPTPPLARSPLQTLMQESHPRGAEMRVKPLVHGRLDFHRIRTPGALCGGEGAGSSLTV